MLSTRKRHDGESDKDLHQKQFLEAFAVSCSVQKAARWAGVHRQCHYDWLKQDSTYPSRFAEARQRAADMLEDEAVRRAREGVCRPVLYRGKQVYVDGHPLFDYEYSDQLLIRLLEANAPDKWKPRTENKNINEWDLSKLSTDQLEALAHQWIQQATGNDPALAEATRKQLEERVRVIEGSAEHVPAANEK
jgi:hypothetical protein